MDEEKKYITRRARRKKKVGREKNSRLHKALFFFRGLNPSFCVRNARYPSLRQQQQQERHTADAICKVESILP